MTTAPQVGDTFGRYHIDRLIGMGGMGMVFVATDTHLNRRVALKVVSTRLHGAEEFLERFHREAEVLARLNSPHITQIFEHGEQDGVPFIATQYVPGGDVSQLLKGRGPMPMSLAATICAQVTDALGDAHRAGVVHRDVKPGNVLLRDPDHPQPQAYLCDFGIAQTEKEGLTVAGGVTGTMTYLAPERIQGHPATPASDIYAVGCLLWATLTGSAPYVGTDVQVARLHREAPVPQFQGEDLTSARLNQILLRSMAKDPAQRYPDAEAMKQELLTLASSAAQDFDASNFTASSAPAQKLQRVRRRRRVLIPALALLLAGGVAGGIWWTREDGAADGPDEPETPVAVHGDLNEDGFGDLALSVWDGSSAGQFLNTWHSDGSTAGEPQDPTADPSEEAPLVADFDGDGRDDRATYESLGQPLSITYADGRTGSMNLPQTGNGEETPMGIIAGDFDGDGRADLAAVLNDSFEAMVLSVQLNEGNAFGEAQKWGEAPLEQYRTKWAVGDFDGDGDDDVAGVISGGVAYRGTQTDDARILVLASQGDGFELAAETTTLDVETWQVGLTTGDVDGDGTDDLVAGTNDHGQVELLRIPVADGAAGEPEVWFSSDLGIGRDAHPLYATSDVDGDGKSDALLVMFEDDDWGEGEGGEIRLARSEGDGFADLETWAPCPECNNYTSVMDGVG